MEILFSFWPIYIWSGIFALVAFLPYNPIWNHLGEHNLSVAKKFRNFVILFLCFSIAMIAWCYFLAWLEST